MDKKKSLLNVIVSISFKIVLLVSSLLNRRFLIQYIGNEVNGLNSLFVSIIGFLSVAELGIGSAITFCMYKPIVEKNERKVAALYCLFKKIYLIVGAIILVGGLIITPFIPHLAADYSSVNVNVYASFLLMLTATLVTYCFSAKTSLLNAYKDNYITTTVNSLCVLFRDVFQIVILFLTKSFILYLVFRIIFTIVEWIATDIITRRKHKKIIEQTEIIDSDTRKDVVKNVKAMFMHKIGGVLVNTADSIIISAFIGVVMLGKYSNYTTIVVSLVGVLNLVFTPLTSVIGHMCVNGDKQQEKKYFNFFHGLNFIIGTIFFLGYFAIIDNLVTLCFGDNLELSKTIAFVITLNQFIQYMRQSVLLFRDATGTFFYDRWKPLFEGLGNLVLSILFVLILPEQYKVVGVIVATIITNIFICHIVEPHVLFKYEFEEPTKKYYIKNYTYIALFIAALVLMYFLRVNNSNQFIELLINGFISVGISFIVFLIIFISNKDLRNQITTYVSKIRIKLKKMN